MLFREMKSFILSILLVYQLCLLATPVCAAEIKPTALPPQCTIKNFKFIAERLVLGHEKGEPQQRFYLLQNTTTEALLLNHRRVQPAASAGWLARLRPGRWSAIAVNRADFSLVCTTTAPGTRQHVTCEDVIKVCELDTKHHNHTAAGTYWVAEDKHFAKLMKAIEARGIKPAPIGNNSGAMLN